MSVLDELRSTYLLASAGVAMEVAFTAVASLRAGDRRLTGYSYLWMFPLYGLAYPLFALAWPVIGDFPILVRAGMYVVVFFVLEYTAGWVLRRVVGECPWEHNYRNARWSIHGLIRLDYAPAWCIAALLFEHLYRSLATT